MEMIVISKKRFEELLKAARDKTQLIRHEKIIQRNNNDMDILAQNMARAFNYELVTFANKIRDEE